MRLILLAMFSFALGTAFPVGDYAKTSGKDVKKEKKESRQSLIERLDRDSARVFKEQLFTDLEFMKVSGEDEAKKEANFLNLMEDSLRLHEKTREALRQAKKKVPAHFDKEEKETRAAIMKMVKARANIHQDLQVTRNWILGMDVLLHKKVPVYNFQVEWLMSKGQWIVSRTQ